MLLLTGSILFLSTWRCLLGNEVKAAKSGFFFHVTDFHLDSNYSENGDVSRWCHSFMDGHQGPDIGKYGNYTCDAPLALVLAALQGMKEALPNPDFIIWTGDSLPHVNNSAYNMQVTQKIKTTFPNTTTFPVLGNHDYWPSNDLPNETNPVYKATAAFWASWLQRQTQYNVSLLSNYGYYSVKLTFNVTLIVLNTNLYYQFNKGFSTYYAPTTFYAKYDEHPALIFSAQDSEDSAAQTTAEKPKQLLIFENTTSYCTITISKAAICEVS